MEVSELFIYPIKSLGGISVESAIVENEGFKYDRRWMLTDYSGRFLSQREIPEMALLSTGITPTGISIKHKINNELNIHIPFEAEISENVMVSVWNHQFSAAALSITYSEWFSDVLKTNVKLVKMDSTSNRQKSLIKYPKTTNLSLADGYPYLFISDASLDDLNSRLQDAVLMNRFRPNVVISDCEPYQEETIDKLEIGDAEFRMIKPCGRCMMITIDQNTSAKLVEPLKTLSTYKKKGNNVYFGMNAVALKKGTINVGDEIYFNKPLPK